MAAIIQPLAVAATLPGLTQALGAPAHMTAVASTSFRGQSGKGEEISFYLSLEHPHQIDDVSWGCVLRMDGITTKPHTTIGVDGWQALTLAIALIEQSLTYFVEDGGKLFFPDSSEPMDIQDVVPRFPSRRT